MSPPATPPDLARVDAMLRGQDGATGDLGSTGRDFARIINRLQKVVRMVLVEEEKTFRRTLQRWRLVDTGDVIELGTERQGSGRFALIARWAEGSGPKGAVGD